MYSFRSLLALVATLLAFAIGVGEATAGTRERVAKKPVKYYTVERHVLVRKPVTVERHVLVRKPVKVQRTVLVRKPVVIKTRHGDRVRHTYERVTKVVTENRLAWEKKPMTVHRLVLEKKKVKVAAERHHRPARVVKHDRRATKRA